MPQDYLDRRAAMTAIALGGALAGGAHAAVRPESALRRLPPIIDVHAHSMLPSWVEAIKRRDGGQIAMIEGLPVPSWSPELALETMDANGIEAMLLSNPIGTKGFEAKDGVPLAKRMNDELATIVSRHPGRFGAFAVLPLMDMDASLEELDRTLGSFGFDGVCLQTNTNGLYLGDPYYEPLFSELNRRRAVAFVHPVTPKFFGDVGLPFNGALLEFMFESTRTITSLIYSGMRQRYPDFTYIATHGGGTMPYLADRITNTNIEVMGGYKVPMTAKQVHSDLRSLVYDVTAATGAISLAALTEFIPAKNLVMGFDYPMMAAQRIAPAIANIGKSRFIADTDMRAIARDNALALFPALAKRLM